jgi:hypothetical protein
VFSLFGALIGSLALIFQNENEASSITKLYPLVMVLIDVLAYFEYGILVRYDIKPGSVERSIIISQFEAFKHEVHLFIINILIVL